MVNRIIRIFLFVVIVILAIISFRPVPIPDSESELTFYNGILDSLATTESEDIVIFLKDSEKNFYLNRAMENDEGQALWEMKEELQGKELSLGYPNYWTLLDPSNSARHVCVLKSSNSTLYSELK